MHQVCSKHNVLSMLLTAIVVLLIYFPLMITAVPMVNGLLNKHVTDSQCIENLHI